VQAVGHPLEARKGISRRKHARPRIIPPRPQVHKVVVVQLAGEAEGGGLRAALGQAEGGVGQVAGQEGSCG
jgi:hypothetical protein